MKKIFDPKVCIINLMAVFCVTYGSFAISQENRNAHHRDSAGSFQVTSDSVNIRENLDAVCRQQFGHQFRLADWNDIKNQFRMRVDPDRILEDGSALVSRNGQRFWSKERHYIITRANHRPDPGYLAHDSLDNRLFDLGSYYPSYRVLCFQEHQDRGTSHRESRAISRFEGHWTVDTGSLGDLDIVVNGNQITGSVYTNAIDGAISGSRIEFRRHSAARQHWIGDIDSSGTFISGTFTWPGGSQNWTASRR